MPLENANFKANTIFSYRYIRKLNIHSQTYIEQTSLIEKPNLIEENISHDQNATDINYFIGPHTEYGNTHSYQDEIKNNRITLTQTLIKTLEEEENKRIELKMIKYY